MPCHTTALYAITGPVTAGRYSSFSPCTARCTSRSAALRGHARRNLDDSMIQPLAQTSMIDVVTDGFGPSLREIIHKASLGTLDKVFDELATNGVQVHVALTGHATSPRSRRDHLGRAVGIDGMYPLLGKLHAGHGGSRQGKRSRLISCRDRLEHLNLGHAICSARLNGHRPDRDHCKCNRGEGGDRRRQGDDAFVLVLVERNKKSAGYDGQKEDRHELTRVNDLPCLFARQGDKG